MPAIDPLSGVSLYVEIISSGQVIGTASGYSIQIDTAYYLITNWHVVTGRDPTTNNPVLNPPLFPDSLGIVHHGQTLGSWIKKVENLYDNNGNPLWIEHPNGSSVDVVALRLTSVNNSTKIYPLSLSLADTDMVPEIAMPVSIIGYPLGLSGPGKFPIWKTGHIASEPALDYNNKPCFLIDATTRGGMSGSPVVLKMNSGFKTRSGNQILAGQIRTLFLGTYSGRIHGESEIGIVWRAETVKQIIHIP